MSRQNDPRSPPRITAIVVLAGGESRRLGRPKAWIDWGGEPLLARIVRRLGPLAPGEVVVAARAGQSLPPTDARRVDDRREGAGPLAGLAAALAEVADRRGPDAAVAVSACDHPFADPALFRALSHRMGTAAVAVPRLEGRLHVLQAVWRARLGEACERALERGERRVRSVVDGVSSAIVDPDSMPPEIDLRRALLNVNDSDDLARARAVRPPRARRPSDPSAPGPDRAPSHRSDPPATP